MKKNFKTISAAVIGIILIGGVVWLGRPLSPGGQKDDSVLKSSGTLAVQEPFFDFGSISMAAGTVSHRFKIKNAGGKTVKIEKIYTSCMCTEAELIAGSESFGPFGMPGHGFIPKINKNVEPNEEAEVEVVFDPSAHGPAGVGRIERVIYIENDAGQPLELKISAAVTP